MLGQMSLWSGKPLWSGYRLKRPLGQGGFGQVWEAAADGGEPVALKFLRCDTDLAGQEIRNILAVQQLDHPHLIRIHKVWADRGYLVVVMERAEGSLLDLLDLCRREYRTPLPPDQVCQYLTQAADALDFLNARQHRVGGALVGIQHGDVKPGNLLVCGEAVKLSDFGLSTPMTAPVVSHRKTGTLAYAAPEVYQGRRSQWTDQYALAVTYCELRTGRLPFPRLPSQFSAKYVQREPDLARLPAAERPIVARALAPVPSDRWPGCGELMARLTTIATTAQNGTTTVA